MELNRANLGLLFMGYNAAFQSAFDGLADDSSQIVLPVPSTTSQNVYGWLGQTTGFREWVGDRVIQNLKTHDYTIKNKKFENTVGVSVESIEDDSYGLYAPLFAQLGQDAREHPVQMAWDLLASGFSKTCFDGQYFFDTDHPVIGANGQTTSVSNFQGGSGNPWFLLDTTRMMKPIIRQTRRPYRLKALDQDKDENVFMRDELIYGVDSRLNVGFGLWQLAFASKQTLDAAAFNDLYADMQSLRGDNGRKLGIRPKLLVVGPSNRAAALEVVKAERGSNGATNINRDVVDVLVTPWLD